MASCIESVVVKNKNALGVSNLEDGFLGLLP